MDKTLTVIVTRGDRSPILHRGVTSLVTPADPMETRLQVINRVMLYARFYNYKYAVIVPDDISHWVLGLGSGCSDAEGKQTQQRVTVALPHIIGHAESVMDVHHDVSIVGINPRATGSAYPGGRHYVITSKFMAIRVADYKAPNLPIIVNEDMAISAQHHRGTYMLPNYWGASQRNAPGGRNGSCEAWQVSRRDASLLSFARIESQYPGIIPWRWRPDRDDPLGFHRVPMSQDIHIPTKFCFRFSFCPRSC